MTELNYYYYWPFQKDLDTASEDETGDLNFLSILLIYKALVKKYPTTNFILKNIAYKNILDDVKKEKKDIKLTNCSITIENPNNNKFFVISQCDKIIYLYENLISSGEINSCIEIFCSFGVQGNDTYLKPLHEVKGFENFKYTPISHKTGIKEVYDKIEFLYQKNKKENTRTIPNKLFFRGTAYGQRSYFLNDNRFQIKEERIEGSLFIDEINRYLINIDVNAISEISCRTLDIFGLGSALIRPKLIVQYHNPLIPNYHYAAIDITDFSYDNRNNVKDAYIEQFEILKRDSEYRNFISENGRKWYEENCTLENFTKIVVDKININKLQ